jgi:PAS domain S-box-containing protein
VARKTGGKNEQEFKKLRNRAEKSLRKRSADLGKSPVKDVQKLVQELRVHQIELEMQNEELRKAQVELMESRDRYSDLYDFAPVGYFTLDEKGLIVEANLAGADLLGFERASVIKKGFSQFVASGSQDAFYSHRKQALENGSKQVSELELKSKNDRLFYAQLQSVAVEGNEGNAIQFRTAVVDITERKRAEVALLESHNHLERRIEERTADLLASNAQLQKEIEERKRMEGELQRSEEELHLLSSRLLTIQEDERKGIALDLHDTIAQNLSAVRIFLEAKIIKMAGSRPPGISLESIYAMLGDCIAELRRIIDHLRPSILDDFGIIVALNRYCAEFQDLHHDIRVVERITVLEKDIPETHKIVIYRIVQEALNNVSKHSQAKTVEISLGKKNGGVALCIEDDGSGFDLHHARSQNLGQGIGLSSMKERAHLTGGSISIQSRKGRGTAVIVSWNC